MDLILRPGLSSVAAIGAAPNANGASVAGTVLTLQPASASFGGLITASAQTIAGAKTFTGIQLITNATASTTTTDGALVVTGGVGVGGRLNVGGEIRGNTLYSTDSSTSQFRLIPGGSIGVMDVRNNANSAYLPLYIRGLSVNFDQGAVSMTDSTASTSTTTGALVVTGGVGVGGKLNVGGVSIFNGATFPVILNGAAATARALRYTTSGTVRWDFAATADAESGSNAGSSFAISAYADGGAYIDDPLFITRAAGGAVMIGRSTASTSTTTGALVVTGGIGCGGRVTVDGASTKTLKYVNGVANAAVAVLFGAIGPTGSTAGNAQGWIRIDVAGTDRYIPYW